MQLTKFWIAAILLVILNSVEDSFGQDPSKKGNKRWAIHNRLLYLGAMQDDCLKDGTQCPFGFGLEFWIQTTNRRGYLVSNGGQSPKSSGFYARKPTPDEYEIGVSLQNNLWRQFLYLKPNKTVHLGFTWDKNQGLKIYVDGLTAAQRRQSETRDYSAIGFDATDSVNSLIANGDSVHFSDLFDGENQPKPGSEQGEVLNMTYYYSNQDGNVREMTKDIDDRLLVGCYATIPSGFTKSPVAMPSPSTSPNASYTYFVCRGSCVGANDPQAAAWNPKAAIVDSKSGNCFCSSNPPAGSTSCQDASALKALSTSVSLSDPTWKPTFTVTIDNPKPIWHLSDFIGFTVNGITEDVTYQFDFGDGSIQVPTKDAAISHMFLKAGTFTIKLTMQYGNRQFSNDSVLILTVVPDHIGRGPSEFEIVSFDQQAKDGSMLVKVALSGEDDFRCRYSLSPSGSGERIREKTGADPAAFLYVAPQELTRIEKDLVIYNLLPGAYNLVVNCSNQYGTLTKPRQFIVPYNKTMGTIIQRSVDVFDILANNFGQLTSPATATIKGSNKPVTISINNATSIGFQQLAATLDIGNNTIEVRANNKLFCTVYLYVYRPPGSPKITTTSPYTPHPKNFPLYYSLYVESGDQIGGTIDFGDGSTKQVVPVFSAPCPCNYSGSRNYNTPGDYVISADLKSNIAGDVVNVKAAAIHVDVPTIGDLKVDLSATDGRIYAGEVVSFEVSVSAGFQLYGTLAYSDSSDEKPFRFDNAVCPCKKRFTRSYSAPNTNNTITIVVKGNYSEALQKDTKVTIFVMTVPIGDAKLEVIDPVGTRYLPGDAATFRLTVNSGENVAASVAFGDETAVMPIVFPNPTCPCSKVFRHNFTNVGNFSVQANVSNIAGIARVRPVGVAIQQQKISDVYMKAATGSSFHMHLGDPFQIDFGSNDGEQVAAVIDFGDGTAVVKQDFAALRRRCPCSTLTDKHTYAVPGMYVATITFSNKVSTKTVQVPVTVNFKLASISVTPSTDQVVTINSDPVTFTVNVESDVDNLPGPVFVECTMEEETVTRFFANFTPSAEPVTFTHVFTKFYSFPILCNAKNNISTVTTDGTTRVRIGTPMTQLAVYPLRTRVGVDERLPFTIALMSGTGVIFDVSFTADGLDTPLKTMTLYQDVFNSPHQTTLQNISLDMSGSYFINVEARNAFGQTSARSCLPVMVYDTEDTGGDCTAVSAVVSTTEKTHIYQSFGGNVTVNIDSDCKRKTVLIAQIFKFANIEDDSPLVWPMAPQLCFVSKYTPYNENDTRSYISIVPGYLTRGKYLAKVEVTVDSYKKNVYTAFDAPFEVEPSPLQAGFSSKDEILMEDQPLIVDFSLSGDPDVGLEDSTDLQFDIVCSNGRQNNPENYTFAEIKKISYVVTESPVFATRLRDFNGTCFENRTIELDIGFRRIAFITYDAFTTGNRYRLDIFVSKLNHLDVGRGFMTVRVATGNMSTDQALDRIEDLLSRGDKSAALNALNSVSQVLNKQSNDSSGDVDGRSRVRERILGMLDNVSSSLDNFNQLQNTGTALKAVTQTRGEVTDDAKQRAGSALANVGNATKGFKTQPLHTLTNVASSIVNAVGNVLPTPAEQASTTSLFAQKLPKTASGVTVTASMFTTMNASTPWLPSLSTVLPSSVFATVMEMATTAPGVHRVPREAKGPLTTTPSQMITTTLSMPSTVTWSSVRDLMMTTMSPLNSTSNGSLGNDTEIDPADLERALAALDATDLPGKRTIMHCLLCGGPPEFNVEREMRLLSKENSFFSVEEMELIKNCAIYRHIDLRCLFYFEDPSEVRQLYRSCRAQEEEILRAKRKRDRALTRNTVGSIDAVSGVLLSKQESGNEGISLSNEQLSLKLVKMNASNASDHAPHAVASETGGFSVPAGVVSNTSSNVTVGMKFMSTASNPFSYDESSSKIKSGVITLAYTNPDGSPMEVSNTSQPIEMRIKGKPEDAPPSMNYTVYAPIADVQQLPMNYHKITLSQNGTSLHIVLKPQTDITAFKVYIGYRFFPNETYYNFTAAVPTNLAANSTVTDQLILDELRYTVFPPAKLTRLNGSYYIGIKILGAKIELPYHSHNYSYNLRMFTSSCNFWDEANETWSTRGCAVGPETTIYETQCLCNHLTSFGTGFMTPPNSIDFNTVWSKFDAKNATVYSVMIALIVLYLLLVVWARRSDKNDVHRWQPRPLVDNLPTDRYYYQVSIYTGWPAQSETQSRVRLIIVGAKGDTGVRCVQPARQSKPFLFKHGSINHFILSTEQPLGPLSYLRVWHDNSGKGHYRSWFLEQIQVSDLQSERKYYFLVDRWLGIDHDDGAVERVAPVASLADLITFKYLFTSDLRRRFSDEHIWMSVVARPTRSVFSRVQRITVCLSMLFTTMLCNAMFYQNEGSEPSHGLRGDGDESGGDGEGNAEANNTLRLGPIKISLHEVWVSVVSSLIIVPIHAIIIFIFKHRQAPKSLSRVGHEHVSTISKAQRWKPVDEKVLSDFDDADTLRRRRNGVRGFFNRAGKRIGGFFGINKPEASENYESEESKEHKRVFKEKKHRKKGFLLPARTVFVAYGLLALCILVSTFFLLLYSMSWGIEKSNRWMVAFVLSFLHESVLQEPIKIIAVVFILSCIFKRPARDESAHEVIESTKEEIENWVIENKGRLTREEFDDISRRRHSKPADLMPPDRDTLADARRRRMHEVEMENVVRDVVVYFLFVAIAFLLSFNMRGQAAYTMYSEINSLMSTNFTAIQTPQDYWNWTNNVALPALYPEKDSLGKCLGWRDAQQISDFANLRIGVPRFRQLRVRENTCKVNKKLGIATHGARCLGEYSIATDDTAPYLPTWVALNDKNIKVFGANLDNLTDASDIPLLRRSPWIYQDSLKLGGVSYSANEYSYKGGGYVAELKRTKRETDRVIEHLMKNNWIDERTRAVFFEFSTYNPNANIFTAPIFVMEFLASGATSGRMDIKVFTVYDQVNVMQLVVYLFGAIFIAYTVFYTRIEYKRFKAAGWRAYCEEYFNIITVAMLVFCYISIIMYFVRFIMARVAAKALVGAGSEVFVNYGALAVNADIFLCFVGFAMFFATMNFLKILNFNRRLAILGMVLKHAMKDIKPFAIVFVGVFFAFAQLYYFCLGTQLTDYRTIIQTIETLIAGSLGVFDFVSMRNASEVVGPFGFVMFVFVVMITMMGMFSVIMETAARIRKELRSTHKQSTDYETMMYLWKKIKALVGIYDDDE